MSDRSRLLQKLLDTWERSDEGEQYLNWLLRPEAEKLDGGDVLREAVLDVMEKDDQLRKLEQKRMEEGLEEIFGEAQVSPNDANDIRAHSAAIFAECSRRNELIRDKAQALARIRHTLDRDRIETLDIANQLMNFEAPDEIAAIFKRSDLAEELAAKLESLGRTSAESIDPEEEWRRLSSDSRSFQEWLRSADKSAEGWFEIVSERLDRYYSRQVLLRLTTIVQRGVALDPAKLEVKNQSVRSLFQEAHETFLYGFDAASIALCRGLVEQSLRDRLAVPQIQRTQFWTMIENAERQKLLDTQGRDHAKKVQKAGNEIMHDISKMRNLKGTAEEILNSTRIVLNQLYSAASNSQ